jgi:hypothetical protein
MDDMNAMATLLEAFTQTPQSHGHPVHIRGEGISYNFNFHGCMEVADYRCQSIQTSWTTRSGLRDNIVTF